MAMAAPAPNSKAALLSLYKKLLRSATTYPSKNREGIFQAIREEWRDHVNLTDPEKVNREIHLAYQGLSQLRQFDEGALGGANSANWTVQMEQNPMPKPDDYDEKREKKG